MNHKDLQLLLAKVEEVKALFVFAQRVVPYIRELVLFVQETTPVLHEMNASIQDSFQKMPIAAQKLDKVSETTETATTNILDALEDMLARLDESMGIIDQMEAVHSEAAEREKKLILQLAGTLDGEMETREANVEAELDKVFAGLNKQQHSVALRQLLGKVQAQAYDIMNLLQVQDITAQQIMAANNMIDSVQKRLARLIGKIEDFDSSELYTETRAFDPKATFEDKAKVQAMADAIMAGKGGEETEPLNATVVHLKPDEAMPGAGVLKQKESASQEDIDRIINEMSRA